MSFSIKDFEEKPYNACLNCVHTGEDCDGPNFLAMTMYRWCEWCKLRKEYLGWTNEYTAEAANVSLITIGRIMRREVKDLRISTMQAVTKALVTKGRPSGSWGKNPCAMSNFVGTETVYKDSPEMVARFEAIEKECVYYKERITFLTSQIAVKDKYLEEKDRQLAKKDKQLEEKDKQLAEKDKMIAYLMEKNRP